MLSPPTRSCPVSPAAQLDWRCHPPHVLITLFPSGPEMHSRGPVFTLARNLACNLLIKWTRKQMDVSELRGRFEGLAEPRQKNRGHSVTHPPITVLLKLKAQMLLCLRLQHWRRWARDPQGPSLTCFLESPQSQACPRYNPEQPSAGTGCRLLISLETVGIFSLPLISCIILPMSNPLPLLYYIPLSCL